MNKWSCSRAKTEAQIREELIDTLLGKSGWNVKELKVRPNREPIQLKTANEFNQEFDELLARHCKPGEGYSEESITGDLQIQWDPPNEEILKIAHSIKHETIDQILAMDDVELAIVVLSGKIKMPWQR